MLLKQRLKYQLTAVTVITVVTMDEMGILCTFLSQLLKTYLKRSMPTAIFHFVKDIGF